MPKVLAILITLLLVGTWQLVQPAAQRLTQNDIIEAVNFAMDERPRPPSVASLAYATVIPSVVRVNGYDPQGLTPVPDGKDARHVIDHAFKRWDLALGSGLGRLNGKVFRIGHLGDCNALMLLSAIGGAELAMHDAGISVPYGAGVAAAQRWYHESH